MQDFIAQARRTRDLWFGSHLLSEISRAAARKLVRSGARLVFPALGEPELDPCDSPLRPSAEAVSAVPNKLVAIAPEGMDPQALARSARQAAEARWLGLAEAARRRAEGLLADDTAESWREQVGTLLELGAAWLPLESDERYAPTLAKLQEALAGRKLLRDFPAWTCQRGSAPKSSLDGARETVLREPSDRPAALVRRYRIGRGEQLDAVGLVKRAGGEPQQFVPIARVALAGWIAAAHRAAPHELERAARATLALGLGAVARTDLPWIKDVFPYDAEVFLEDRWPALLSEGAGAREQTTATDAREWGRRHVGPLLDRMHDPRPYVACLVADGDRMGATLKTIGQVDAHRTFSARLSRFATEARRVVEQEYRGIVVYAGGDDVLAFVCVDDALDCAQALQATFAETMRSALPEGAHRPTLSVGLGVGHVLDGLGMLRELGRRAEHRAKVPLAPGEGGERNALAVVVDKRSGGEVAWRARWDGPEGNPVARLRADIGLLERRLSTKKVLEVQSDLRRMPDPAALLAGEMPLWADVVAADIRRTLARGEDGEGVEPVEVGLDLGKRDGYGPLYQRISRWVSRMLVAREIRATLRAAGPRRADRGA